MKISEFQSLMKELYFHQDTNRGLKGTFIWLVEEVGELANLLKSKKVDNTKASEELSDIFAWVCSLANILDIDLEESCKEKYPNKCIKCNSNPCKCENLRSD